ncbi:2-amino-4-hydroxy-6-hydroxymethyldihydropteridine diphosphokinase [Actibacterium sp. 188UL27-1]|uniref:2-amino-4-hydroxy-6- hydroxymethyldihydropteridine diphosphokinase n=1 Tax=Actibacterium sp. 188UL27-1 TaxID=2786961 RepID=UPI00195DCD4C|nr:2-amino-4-hydroxy-6-hydroxymethyldihydropteridine diphosphokinase [Actibacterium sp. 188UL27-1]MBM7067098.1 2-amino-4-hydroxy-6-hydroxymethyldihydropteridine diphosphokinase [Actibacterium sp. 188UL27-1]
MSQPSQCHRIDTCAIIALGSNVTSRHGSPKSTINTAITSLNNDSLIVLAESRLYSTPCMPIGAGPDYINAVVVITTGLSASALLSELNRIEAEFDRQRTNRWAARTLDLDLIDYNGQIYPDANVYSKWRDLSVDLQAHTAPDQLILPHPRIQDRAFVLVPLCDVAPNWAHPVTGQTARQMLGALPLDDVAAVKPISAQALVKTGTEE